MSFQDTLPNGLVIGGDYRIERLLGSGGFANTYLAKELSLQRHVAVKEYFPREVATRIGGMSVGAKSNQFTKDYNWGLQRFANEARILARFRHPNIVRVNRVLDQHNTAYIVLEYVEGADFDRWLRRQREREHPHQAEFDRLLPGLIEALGWIHSQGVLHRDIKPANIYIRQQDGTPVLLDFGASKLDFGEKTGTTAAIISRGYSPQETYATDASLQGPWTDIYGLAATIYFALFGRAPPESTARVLNDDIVPASSLPLKGFRPSFLAAVDWGLSVHAMHRPKSVAEWMPSLFDDVMPPRLAPQKRQVQMPLPGPMPAQPAASAALSARSSVQSRPMSGPALPSGRFPQSGRVASAHVAHLQSPSHTALQPALPSARSQSQSRTWTHSHGRSPFPPGQVAAHGIGMPPVGYSTGSRKNRRLATWLVLALVTVGGAGLGAWQWGSHVFSSHGASAAVMEWFGGPGRSRSEGRGGGSRGYSDPYYPPGEGSSRRGRDDSAPQRARPASHTPPSYEPPRRQPRNDTGVSAGASPPRPAPSTRSADPSPSSGQRSAPVAVPQ